VPDKQGKYLGNDRGQEKNPHFFKKQNKNQNNGYWRREDNWTDRGKPEQAPEPMDVDPSFSKLRHPSNFKPSQGNNTQSPTPQNRRSRTECN